MLAAARTPVVNKGERRPQRPSAAVYQLVSDQHIAPGWRAGGQGRRGQGEESGDGAAVNPPKVKKSLDSGKNEDEDEHRQSTKVWKGLLTLRTPTGWHRQPKRSPNWTLEVGTMKSNPESSHHAGEAMCWSSGQSQLNAPWQPASTASPVRRAPWMTGTVGPSADSSSSSHDAVTWETPFKPCADEHILNPWSTKYHPK